MKKLVNSVPLLVALIALVCASVAFAQQAGDSTAESTAPSAEPTSLELGTIAPERPTVVSRHTKRPRKVVRKVRRFTPDAHPSPKRVREIIAIEQRIWGGPSIARRVDCESDFRWNATNGQYRGLLQIGSWWATAWPQTPRKVVLRKVKFRRKPVIRITRYSDGRVERKVVGKMRQKVVRLRKGKLPADASPYHGWAAIRVGQRAASGAGPSTMWECSL